MKLKGLFPYILILLSTSLSAQDLVQISAVGSYKYSFFKKSEARAAAMEAAKESALKKYIASQPMAKQRALLDQLDLLTTDMDLYIPEVAVQQEMQDKDSKQYKVAIIAKINPVAFDVLLTNQSEAGQQPSGFSSDFGAMFVARVEESRKQTFDKTTSVSKTDNTASLEDMSTSDGESTVESSRARSLETSQSGGSVEQKRATVDYVPSVEISEEVAYVVEELLVNAGFEPMSYSDLDGVPYLDEIVDEMRDSGRLPTATLKLYQNAAIEAGWTFFGMGTIDIGAPQSDSQRGTIRVPATVSFRVWSLEDGRAKTVASVRPQVVYGQDRGSASVAETNAYNEAAAAALNTVVAQLQQKGLR